MSAQAAKPKPKPRRSAAARLVPIALAAAILIVVVIAGGSCLSVRIPESGSRQTVLFYAAPTDLRVGARLDRDELEERLVRLGYKEGERPLEPGQYRLLAGGAEIDLRPFRYPDRDFHGGRLRVRIRDGEVADAQPLDPLEPKDLRLDPERIAGFEGEQGAVLNPLRLEDAPPLLVKSIIAVEDRRFYQHPGIDPIGTARAVWEDLRHHESAQGGSTLTQQLARSLYLHNRKTFTRKIQEAVIAIGLEMRYSKRQILEAYLNAVYWGTWGPMEIRGAREAARYYLGCNLEDADPAGIALLVGLIRAPNAYSPYVSPERARRRRDVVLHLLEEKGILTAEQTRAALARPLPSKKPPIRLAEAAYFLEAARKEVEERAPDGTLKRPGTAVFTTLDPRDQAAAVSALQQGLRALERDHRNLKRKKDPLQAAVVVMDPQSGEVRALIGGRDYLASPFNRAIDAHRQPGSLFKPFVYLAAFRHPRRDDGTFWTPATILHDEPVELGTARNPWSPQNYDRQFRGDVTVRTALEQSLNVPTASLASELGVKRVVEAAHDMGVASPLDAVPSIALGTSDVTLLEITEAYGGLANSGRPHAATLLRAIQGPGGEPVPLTPLRDPSGVDPQEVYLVDRLLQGVIESGTGKTARALGVQGVVAGKTGTTDEYRDAWFVGFTPRRVTGVWVGFDHRDEIGLTGSAAALPIWAEVMKRTTPDGGDGDFPEPDGIVRETICVQSGLLATGDCPDFREEVFIEGTEPRQECDEHGGGLLDRVRRFFRI